MIIRLTPSQVPEYWELIKFGISEVESRSEEDLPFYFTHALYELLSGKAQCYFILEDETRIIKALLINRILSNQITGKLTLYTEYLYAFRRSDPEEYTNIVKLGCEFARNNNCEMYEFDSSNPKIWEIVEHMRKEIDIDSIARNYTIKL